MPYIKQALRDVFDASSGGDLEAVTADDAGELNFLVSTLCSNYLRKHGVRYENINAVVGVLECAKLELYRRLAAPYEDSKVLENGDMPLYARMRQ